MRNFTFEGDDEEAKFEDILQKRKKKIANQQVIFTIVLSLIIGAIGLYIFKKTYFTTLDGYVQLSQNYIKPIGDIFIRDCYVKIGDFVEPGDTLFSFVNLKILQEQENLNDEPKVVTIQRDLEIQSKMEQHELITIRTKKKELERQIEREKMNIALGLTDKRYKAQLEKELRICLGEMEEKKEKIKTLVAKRKEIKETVDLLGYERNLPMNLYELSTRSLKGTSLLSYEIARDSAFVTKINVAEKSIAFRGDDIMTMQYSDLFASNFYIACYMVPDDMEGMAEGVIADVVFNDDLVLKAELTLCGAYDMEIPDNIRGKFSNQTQALISIFRLLPGQKIPFWATTPNLQVKIKIDNLQKVKNYKKNGEMNSFNTTSGRF